MPVIKLRDHSEKALENSIDIQESHNYIISAKGKFYRKKTCQNLHLKQERQIG